jgi:rhodanese-related sulfurtransferase
MKALLILSFSLIVSLTACEAQDSSVKNIKSNEMETLMQEPDVVVIDVRTPSEVQSGYISTSKCFIDVNDREFNSKIDELDKEKTYIVYCKSGARSSYAANYMAKNGFTKVYNLTGGIMNWKNQSYLTK